MLVAHLLLIERGTVRVLGLPSSEKPLSPYAFVARYRPSVEAIAASTAETAGEHSVRSSWCPRRGHRCGRPL